MQADIVPPIGLRVLRCSSCCRCSQASWNVDLNGAENMMLMHDKFETAYDQMRVTIIPMTSDKYQVNEEHSPFSIIAI